MWAAGVFALCFSLAIAVTAPDVSAGQSSSGFSVGVRIVAKGKKPPKKPMMARRSAYTAIAAQFTLFKARYDAVRMVSTAADLYWFKARSGGLTYRVAVSRLTGEIVAKESASHSPI